MLRAIVLALASLASPSPSRPAAMPPPVSSDPVIRGDLADLVRRCDDDPARFCWSVLGDRPDAKGLGGLWSMQRAICRSVARNTTTVVVAGNAVGKTHLAARLVLWFLYRRPGSMVISTAPTMKQLDGVLWNGIRQAHGTSKVELGGEICGSSPIELKLAPKWYAIGHSANTVEGMSGHHSKDLFFVADEASGVSDVKMEAGNSLIPTRKLYIGNPIRPDGPFYETARKAEQVCIDRPGNTDFGFFRIRSLDSPHADWETSPYGMASRSWLRQMAMEYGEDSLWWLSHILAQFPGDTAESLLRVAWLDRAERAAHTPSGHVRTAADLAGGNGGDLSVVMTRDDNGILGMDWSNRWDLGETARKIAEHVERFDVAHHRVTYDRGGLGQDFPNRLEAVGIKLARGYLGNKLAKNAQNLRSAAARQLRFRLDPNYLQRTPAGVMVAQPPFAIPAEYMAVMRPQLRALRYVLDPLDRFAMEFQDELRARIKCSPDFAETIIQSFAFQD